MFVLHVECSNAIVSAQLLLLWVCAEKNIMRTEHKDDDNQKNEVMLIRTVYSDPPLHYLYSNIFFTCKFFLVRVSNKV